MSATVDAEEIRKHTKTYLMVFGALAVLTIVTVAVGYLELPIHTAVIVALAIACTKGALVALHFMHLIHEEKAIYWTLGLTAFFFVLCLALPVLTDQSNAGEHWFIPAMDMPGHEAAGHH